eukprot:scaffold14667_cov26-Attheya_sp.AAC.1
MAAVCCQELFLAKFECLHQHCLHHRVLGACGVCHMRKFCWQMIGPRLSSVPCWHIQKCLEH